VYTDTNDLSVFSCYEYLFMIHVVSNFLQLRLLHHLCHDLWIADLAMDLSINNGMTDVLPTGKKQKISAVLKIIYHCRRHYQLPRTLSAYPPPRSPLEYTEKAIKTQYRHVHLPANYLWLRSYPVPSTQALPLRAQRSSA
jgi:hypothetical protein